MFIWGCFVLVLQPACTTSELICVSLTARRISAPVPLPGCNYIRLVPAQVTRQGWAASQRFVMSSRQTATACWRWCGPRRRARWQGCLAKFLAHDCPPRGANLAQRHLPLRLRPKPPRRWCRTEQVSARWSWCSRWDTDSTTGPSSSSKTSA